LHIVDEAFVRVHINLLAIPGTPLNAITSAMSHTVLLGQCRKFLTEHNIRPVTGADTAGSAQHVAEICDPAQAALASELAGEIYGLDLIRSDIEDAEHNTTRFVVLSRDSVIPDAGSGNVMTSFVFRVRNIPAALYKAMGGFSTNGVNMTKLESYVGAGFIAAQFYAEVEGHPEDGPLKLALEELGFFSEELTILGVFPADPFRKEAVPE